jgi:hypothetical protein
MAAPLHTLLVQPGPPRSPLQVEGRPPWSRRRPPPLLQPPSCRRRPRVWRRPPWGPHRRPDLPREARLEVGDQVGLLCTACVCLCMDGWFFLPWPEGLSLSLSLSLSCLSVCSCGEGGICMTLLIPPPPSLYLCLLFQLRRLRRQQQRRSNGLSGRPAWSRRFVPICPGSGRWRHRSNPVWLAAWLPGCLPEVYWMPGAKDVRVIAAWGACVGAGG